MTPRLFALLALTLAATVVDAAEPVRPQRGEPVASFQCRAALVPEARACAARCEASLAGDARFECIHACTTRGLWQIAKCREEGAPAAAQGVASR